MPFPSTPSSEFSLHLLTVPTGGGHNATVEALRAIAERQQRPWQIQITDLTQLLAPLDPSRKWLGLGTDDIYNWILNSGWTQMAGLTIAVYKATIALKYDAGVEILTDFWHRHPPDLVVSAIPFLNRGIWDSVQKAKPGTPVATIITDFADCPPHFWIEPETGIHWICGTDRLVEQVRSFGIADDRIFSTSGMAVHPQFYEPIAVDRRAQKKRLGLDPDRPTALVLFGAQGSSAMLEIARCLEPWRDRIQLIFICGHKEKLAKTLQKNPRGRFVTTFTRDIPYYMHLADFFIGKPGPGSISEALAMKLPVITECNRTTMMQERYVAEWIVEKKVGRVVSSFRRINGAVEELLKPDNLVGYQANVNELKNRAIFEIPDILQKIIDYQSLH